MFGLLVFGTIALFIVGLARASGEGSYWRPTVIVIGGLFLLGSWPPGYVDIRLACRDDGGFRVKRKIHTDGFLLLQNRAYSTSMSRWDYDPAVTGKVRYMDFNQSIWSHPYQRHETVYRRAFLSTPGDPRCIPYDNRGHTLKPGACLAVEGLSRKPASGYALREYGGNRRGTLFSNLPYHALDFVDLSTGEVIGSQRRYAYFAPLSHLGERTGPTYSCPKGYVVKGDFLEKVLK